MKTIITANPLTRPLALSVPVDPNKPRVVRCRVHKGLVAVISPDNGRMWGVETRVGKKQHRITFGHVDKMSAHAARKKMLAMKARAKSMKTTEVLISMTAAQAQEFAAVCEQLLPFLKVFKNPEMQEYLEVWREVLQEGLAAVKLKQPDDVAAGNAKSNGASEVHNDVND